MFEIIFPRKKRKGKRAPVVEAPKTPWVEAPTPEIPVPPRGRQLVIRGAELFEIIDGREFPAHADWKPSEERYGAGWLRKRNNAMINFEGEGG